MVSITLPRTLTEKVEALVYETFGAKVFYAEDGSEALIVQVHLDRTNIISVDEYGQVASTATGIWEAEDDV